MGYILIPCWLNWTFCPLTMIYLFVIFRDLNMLSDSESSHLDLQDQSKGRNHQSVEKTIKWSCLNLNGTWPLTCIYKYTGDRPPRSPGVDPKQLAAELQKVSQQQVPSSSASALDKSSASAGSSAVPSPGQPGSPSVSKKRHSKVCECHTHTIFVYTRQMQNYVFSYCWFFVS